MLLRTSVRMRRKDAERQEARELRLAGWPLRRIADELEVSLSSVSAWVRDLPKPPPRPRVRVPRPAAKIRIAAGGSRRCPRCDTNLPLSAFNRMGDGHQGWCRECFRVYFRERGTLHREQCAASKRQRAELGAAFIDDHLRSHSCVDCDLNDPDVLEFDHRTEKTANLSVLVGRGTSVDGLRAEVERCDVVCVNCHRRRTAHVQGSWRLEPETALKLPYLTPHERRNLEFVRRHLLEGECVDCGTTDLVVLDFDHVGRKTGRVAQMARAGCSFRRLQAEIRECVLRCANCHRRRTRRHLGHRLRTQLAA